MDRILTLLIKAIVFLAGFSKKLARMGIGSYEEWAPGKKLKLLLVGYNGARNTGADARVVAIVRQIKRVFGADKVDITVMTLNAKTLDGYFDEDVRLLEFSTVFPLDLYRACCVHHAAVICEGSTLKSTFANALTLFFCEASGIMAGQNKPCIAYGSEIGAMEPFVERFAAKVCGDTYFITRTEGSQRALEKLGLKGHVGTDTAWFYEDAVPRQTAEELLVKAGWDGKKPLLGIAVIDPFCWPVRASLKKWFRGKITGNMKDRYDRWYFYSTSLKRTEAFEKYIASISLAVTRYIAEKDMFPVLIGMERMDAKACGALEKAMQRKCASFCSGECPADIMAGILNRLSLLVTSRYHAAVLSMESGVPIAAVSMDERLDGIMRELSFEKNFLFGVVEADLAEKLYRAMNELDAKRREISCHILSKREEYKEKLDGMGRFLKTYIDRRLS